MVRTSRRQVAGSHASKYHIKLSPHSRVDNKSIANYDWQSSIPLTSMGTLWQRTEQAAPNNRVRHGQRTEIDSRIKLANNRGLLYEPMSTGNTGTNDGHLVITGEHAQPTRTTGRSTSPLICTQVSESHKSHQPTGYFFFTGDPAKSPPLPEIRAPRSA
jgi:hypothetical protein